MPVTSLRAQLASTHKGKLDSLNSFISGRRRIKSVLRHLRNAPVNSIHISGVSWSPRYSHSAYIYLSQRVTSMKQCEALLGKIDALPGIPEYDDQPDGWSTTDNAHDGTRIFTRALIHNSVNITISLTAIPDEKSGEAKCRRVIVGQKEVIDKRTEPVYEIICEE